MRRDYISPEYKSVRVYGTFNMLEESNFFGSKMLEIEDSIIISNQEIIYYQNENGEQIDYSIESSIESYNYSAITDKQLNHTLVIDNTQPLYQKNENTKWILTIDLEKIITNYIFANLKKYRTFEGVKKDMTIYDDVNVAISNYINFNVYNRYKVETIDLYVTYNSLRNQNILKFKNTWNRNVESSENKLTRVQTEYFSNNSKVRLIFNQEKPSKEFSYNYFFNVNLTKL
jgi:hypothetical protein